MHNPTLQLIQQPELIIMTLTLGYLKFHPHRGSYCQRSVGLTLAITLNPSPLTTRWTY